MTTTHSGACCCGAVEIQATGTPVEMGYCHCRSCRSYSGGPLTAFTLWEDGRVRVTNGSEFLGRFNKTGFSERRFCTRCGGHVMTKHPGFGFTDVHAAVFPTLVFAPTVHLNYAEAALPVLDGLPQLKLPSRSRRDR